MTMKVRQAEMMCVCVIVGLWRPAAGASWFENYEKDPNLQRALIASADKRGCGRVDWTVLDWNAPAIA